MSMRSNSPKRCCASTRSVRRRSISQRPITRSGRWEDEQACGGHKAAARLGAIGADRDLYGHMAEIGIVLAQVRLDRLGIGVFRTDQRDDQAAMAGSEPPEMQVTDPRAKI